MSYLVNVSQRNMPDDPNPDLDECWLAATETCARYHQPGCPLPTVRQARSACKNPDGPGPDGGTLDDIMEVVAAYFPDFGVRQFNSPDWAMFRNYLSAGWVAAVAVISAELPASLRYGFKGPHEIAAQLVDGKFLTCNPLALGGSAPQAIPEASLRSAAQALGGGSVQAALFPPGDVSMIYLKEAKTGKFVVKAGSQPRAWKLGPGGLVAVKTPPASSKGATFAFDHRITRVGDDPDPRLNVMLHGTAGFYADLYVAAGSVSETYDPPPVDTTPYSQADIEAARLAGHGESDAAWQTWLATAPR